MTIDNRINRKTNEEIAGEIVGKYYESHPNTATDIGTIYVLTLQALELIKKYGDKAENKVSAIASEMNTPNKNDMTSIDTFFTDLNGLLDLIAGNFPKNYKSCEKPCDKKEPVKNEKREPVAAKPQCKCAGGKTCVKENETEKTVQVLMPGLEKNQISVTVEDGKLIICPQNVIYGEVSFVNPEFRYEFNLDETCDTENAASSLKNGVLTVRIPKRKKKTHIINIG